MKTDINHITLQLTHEEVLQVQLQLQEDHAVKMHSIMITSQTQNQQQEYMMRW